MKLETKFVRSADDLLIKFPSMEEIATATMRMRVHHELGDFNSAVKYLENLVDHGVHRDFSDLTQETATSFIDYVSMQIGLNDAGEDFRPLSWLALILLLRSYGAPYPRKLIASFEHFHLLWDIDRFLAPVSTTLRETRYPRYVADFIRLLSATGLDFLENTNPHDVY